MKKIILFIMLAHGVALGQTDSKTIIKGIGTISMHGQFRVVNDTRVLIALPLTMHAGIKIGSVGTMVGLQVPIGHPSIGPEPSFSMCYQRESKLQYRPLVGFQTCYSAWDIIMGANNVAITLGKSVNSEFRIGLLATF